MEDLQEKIDNMNQNIEKYNQHTDVKSVENYEEYSEKSPEPYEKY